jgi:hypothetical protein
VSFDKPVGVVGLAEVEQRLTQFFDGVEGPHPKKVLFQAPTQHSCHHTQGSARAALSQLDFSLFDAVDS